jgi:hypothetical protein
LIQDAIRLDSIITLSQRNIEFCNNIGQQQKWSPQAEVVALTAKKQPASHPDTRYSFNHRLQCRPNS